MSLPGRCGARSTLADVNESPAFPPPWAIAGGVAAALALIFLLGVGFGQQWGADQWGPLAAWVAGAATFGAVVVALREAARSQRARAVDHEISRRRECIAALGELWGALVGLIIDFRTFVDYLDDLGQNFNPATGVVSPGPGERQVLKTYGEVIGERIQDFFDKWAKAVEPPLLPPALCFVAPRLTMRWSRSISMSTQSKPMGSEALRGRSWPGGVPTLLR